MPEPEARLARARLAATETDYRGTVIEEAATDVGGTVLDVEGSGPPVVVGAAYGVVKGR